MGPADEVGIFKSGLSEAKETAMKDRMRSGSMRVLIGTTGRLGIGVDIADKIVAGHHLTVPDRPMERAPLEPDADAMIIHWPKAMAGASGKRMAKIRTKERFGGVPTRVASPPTEQE